MTKFKGFDWDVVHIGEPELGPISEIRNQFTLGILNIENARIGAGPDPKSVFTFAFEGQDVTFIGDE